MRLIDEFLGERPTKTLFHYTTARGLIGIFESGNIYASSVYHLNDSKEFHYAIELIVERLHDRLQRENGPWNTMYGQLLEQMPSTVKGAQAFVASFSEEGDLLSQWMAYSGPSCGFALGFSPDHFDATRIAGFTLVRCVYERERQVELANAAIDALCQADVNPDEEGINKILIVAAALKHPGFVQEAEWRLIKPLVLGTDGSRSILFREGRVGLVPYLTAPLMKDTDDLVPRTIHIGPSQDTAAAETAVSTLLFARGLKHILEPSCVEVVSSRTPYRP
jgi:hypothetical protein